MISKMQKPIRTVLNLRTENNQLPGQTNIEVYTEADYL